MLCLSLAAFLGLTTLTGGGPPRFSTETIDNQVTGGQNLAIGDVDGDGKLDILLAESNQLVWYRNGDWKRFVMADNLTNPEGTCIAIRDLDGKAEIAVASGSVHYLARPEDPTHRWTPVRIHPSPPAHQLQWVKVSEGRHQLVILPRLPEQNGNGPTQTPTIWAYEKPTDPTLPWKQRLIMLPMPLAYDLEVYDYGDREVFYVSGDGGVMGFFFKDGRWKRNTADWLARGRQLGKVRFGAVASRNAHVFTAFEPLHGNMVTIYTPGLTDSLLAYDKIKRIVLERKIHGGTGLEIADLLNIGRDQVIAGWKRPNDDGFFGIKLYVPFNKYWEAMDVYWVDRGGIDCEGLAIADMDNDGKPDIVAYGGVTRNLNIYWNRTE
ncbi:FG-GAP repeat domain-containing protein [Parapedobacter sp. GCM10030251]|uniref:FG-GAP repeat domain-containing protein n=1 Tax=Parapedobacter sp. GCM10030251 TaxID=3273419 RepID=UPI00361E1E95